MTTQLVSYDDLTILIPFYNEAERLPKVLEAILPYLDARMILCVDDGSTDGGLQSIRSEFPQVRLVSTIKNGGKSAAVQYGLNQVASEYVMLLDADLKDLNGAQLADGIARFKSAISEGKQIDMLIFRRSDDPLHYKVVRADVLYSGERILRTELLKNIYASRTFTKYQLELFINEAVRELDGKVYWVPLQSHNPDKMAKWKNKNDAVQGTVDLLVGTFSKPEFVKMITAQYFQFGMEEL